MNLTELDPVTFAQDSRAPAYSLDRRSFIRLTGLFGGGLTLALFLKAPEASAAPGGDSAVSSNESEFQPNLFIRILATGEISILASNPECGQGVKTALPMIIAEELDVEWEQIQVVQADFNPDLGRQMAAGSMATPTHYEPFRRLGATARTMLVTAAAESWGVAAGECSTGAGKVVHAASGRSATYGELVARASRLSVPEAAQVQLKDPKNFRVMGRRIGGVDNRKIVTGQPLFGIDQELPGLVHATYVRCPVFGGKVRSANLDKVKSARGVREAIVIDAPGVAAGVAIIADSTWNAFQARNELDVTWDEGRTAGESSEGFAGQAETLWKQGENGTILRQDGDVNAALSAPDIKKIEARYTYPFIPHANLEPQNCTALFKDGSIELWAPTQNPQGGSAMVARALSIDAKAIKVHMLRMGGGFGRRLSNDFMAEAAAIAAKIPGTPVKLTWTREDDMKRDWYRAAGFHELRGGVNASGNLVAWSDHFITFANGYTDPAAHGTAALNPDEFPGRFVPNCLIRQTPLPNGIPMGPWRAPRASAQAFAHQSFIDELAHASGQDPVAFRLKLLGEPRKVPPSGPRGAPYDSGRMAGVVKLAAETSDWGKPMPRGSGRGIAFHFSHLGYVAIVAEVTVSPEGQLRVDRVVVAADVGRQIINPSGAENQSEGSVVDGISTCLRQQITIQNGRVQQSNFHDVALIRINEAPPKIDVHFLITDNPPTGLGEPVIPPVPPALTNAIFAATGKRIRSLPLSLHDLSWT